MEQIAMKTLVFAFLLGTVLQDAAARIHSLKYFYTGSSQVPNFPEFVIVGMVDDVQMVHYDSNTRRTEPKQDWMSKVTADDPQYWERETQISVGHQQWYKAGIEIIKPRFNQTGGVHTFQWMYGCEWDDETDEVNGFTRWGYDGEDFVAFDLKTESWIAPTPQAHITKNKWDHDRALIAQRKNYLTQLCPESLKKYVNYGRSSLLRTALPSVFLLQQTPSSPVRCFASGFYPERASLFWRKDGDDLHEDVEHGEILPNTDGTFQMSVDLKVSSIKPEDWRRYECVFQLSGVKDDIVTKLDKTAIRTNWETSDNMVPIIIAAAVVVVALIVAGIVGVGLYMFKKKSEDSKSKPSTEPSAVVVQVSGSSSSISSTVSADSSKPLMDISRSSSSISSTGGGDSSKPLMDNSSSSISSEGSGDSSKPLMDNREVTRNSLRTARTEDEICTVEVVEHDLLEKTQSVIQT